MELVEGTTSIADLDAFLDELSGIGAAHDATLQAFDARYVAGEAHLEQAVAAARRARERGAAIARDHAVEILLYAAGRRQINRAIEMGVDEGEHEVVVVVTGGATQEAAADVRDLLTPADALAQSDRRTIMEFFEITDAERAATDAALESLVCERVALLTVEK
jgi:KEOPS complex subunit Cgi121